MIDVSDRTRPACSMARVWAIIPPIDMPTTCADSHLERIEQTDRVGRHVGEQVLGLDRTPGHRAEHRLDLARRLPGELGGETDVAVVERDHPETGGDETVDELVGPVDQLATEAHHEQQRFAVAA